jgi:signal transduction histidine kinase/ligand-binding sensor domain-containing protein
MIPAGMRDTLAVFCLSGVNLCLLVGGEISKAAEVPQVTIDSRPIILPVIDGADLRFTRPALTDQLSQTKAGQMAQDDRGFMWFGTQYGLNRFDGYTFKIFVHDPGNPVSLNGVFVSALFKDRNGVLWIGCDQFLNKFDQATEVFTRYPVPFATHISQDSAGLLWSATGSGLYSLDPVSGRILRYVHNPEDPASLGSNDVKSAAEDKNGRFWVATAQGFDELDRKRAKVVLHIPVNEPSNILSFYEDRSGTFWIYQVSRNALAVFDRKTNTLTRYLFREQESPETALTGITSMVEDQAGSLWMGTHGDGLLRFDREHKRFIRYRNNPANPDSLPQDDVESLFTDREGSIWAGLGSKGLTRFSTQPMPFRRLPHGLGNPNSAQNPFIGALYEDQQGILWVGTPDALNRIDTAGNYTAYRRAAGQGARTDAIAICEDRSQNVWVGTYGHGLLRFEPGTGKFQTYRHAAANPHSLSDDFVSRLLIDHQGTLWAASSEALSRFDAATGQFTSFRSDPRNGSPFYLELVEDSHGTLWLGTHSSGLQRFDPATGEFTDYYLHDLNRRGTLSDNRVNSIHFDRAGTMWIGTQNGLDRFDPKTGTFTTFTRGDGLPGNVVGCVLEDDHGNLWMSTNSGVASFDPQTHAMQSYSAADGLPGPDLTGWGACSKGQDGELYFGGFSGGVSFYPDVVAAYPLTSHDNSYVPPVVLTEFRLSGRPVEIGHGSPLAKSIADTNRLTLSYRQTNFSLTFSALSYANPVTNRYRYMLEGVDEGWHEVGSDERLATYTTVPAGKHTFRVQAATRHGRWSVPGAELSIEILPPIWQTGWFLTACSGSIALSLFLLYLARIRRLEYQFHLRMEERINERTRIARDLHDTLLQSLNGLLLRFQAVSNLLPARPSEAKQRIDSAIEQASATITEARDAVHELRAGGFVTADLAQAIGSLSKEILSGSTGEIAPELRVQEEGTPRNLNPMVRDEIYRIAAEALRNAIRHAMARRIEVEIRYDERHLRIRIRDDGKGIDPNVVGSFHAPGHWGLRGMRERAKLVGGSLEVWSELDSGTEVELSIPAASAYGKPAFFRWSPFGRMPWS